MSSLDWPKYLGIAAALAFFFACQAYLGKRNEERLKVFAAEKERFEKEREEEEARRIAAGGTETPGELKSAHPPVEAPEHPPNGEKKEPKDPKDPKDPAPPVKAAPPEPHDSPPVRVTGKYLDLTFTARGGALKKVDLADVKPTARSEAPGLEILDEIAPGKLTLGVEGFTFAGATFSNLETAIWEQTENSAGFIGEARVWTVAYARTLHGKDGPLCRVTKRFKASEAARHVDVELAVENLGASEAKCEYALRGPAGILLDGPPEDPKQHAYVSLKCALAGSRAADSEPTVMTISPQAAAAPEEEKRRLSSEENLWAATINRFFMAALIAREPERTIKILVEPIQHLSATMDKRYSEPNLSPVFHRKEAILPPGPAAPDSYVLFLGPVNDGVLTEYEPNLKLAKPAHLYMALQYCEFWNARWPTIDRLARIMLWIFNTIVALTGSYGLAVILLTLVVKLAIHPIQRKMTVSMHKMQALQPRLKAIDEKYAAQDKPEIKQKREMEKWDLMRKEGVNPTMGCLPMLLQMPIFFALYGTFNHAYEIRQAQFLWVQDLSLPDRLASLPFWPHELNLLPLLYVCLTLYQTFSQPKPATEDPQQEMQRKMMLFMPVMFAFIFYSMPSGMVLYFAASACFGLLETWYVKKHVLKVAPKSAA